MKDMKAQYESMKTFICGILVSLVWCMVTSAASLPPDEYVFQAEGLRLRQVHLRLPAGELIDYTGKNDQDEAPWRSRFTASPDDPNLWQVRLVQETDAVRREVDYWVFVPTPDDPGPMEPVFASEAAFVPGSGICLYRAQSMDWQLRYRETVYTVATERVTAWVLGHLQDVYDADILAACADFFFHDPGDADDTSGYSKSVACSLRSIELDPQAIDLYTTSAWLLWSNWVTWKQDPQRVSDGPAKLELAIQLIKQGRAANPDSALYHYDAANTMAPLARHHLPDLMDWVIHYYHHAEALATDKALRVQICKVLGHRYRIQGKIEEAIRWYRVTLELDPDNKVARRYLERLQKERNRDHSM
jgi:tetratricopeptide (TPR) repeat protein